MKCTYKHCFCQDKEVIKEPQFRCGVGYFHEECLNTKNDIAAITDLFLDKVNANAVRAQLINVINNIIFVKGFTTEYLMFGLKYFIDHKKLNYPQGLYYVIQDKDVKDAYDRMKAQQIKNEMKDVGINESNETTFTYKPNKVKGFGDILGGN